MSTTTHGTTTLPPTHEHRRSHRCFKSHHDRRRRRRRPPLSIATHGMTQFLLFLLLAAAIGSTDGAVDGDDRIPLPVENGLLVLSAYDDFSLLPVPSPPTPDLPSPSRLLLLLLYDEKCPHSATLLRTIESAAALLPPLLPRTDPPPPLFGKLELPSFLDGEGEDGERAVGSASLGLGEIESLPTLLFVVWRDTAEDVGAVTDTREGEVVDEDEDAVLPLLERLFVRDAIDAAASGPTADETDGSDAPDFLYRRVKNRGGAGGRRSPNPRTGHPTPPPAPSHETDAKEPPPMRREMRGVEYVGPGSSPGDVVDTAFHLWYRLIVSESMGSRLRTDRAGGGDVSLPKRPVFPVRSIGEVREFVEGDGGGLFHEVEQDLEGVGSSVEEEDYIRRLLDFSGGDGGVASVQEGADGVEDEGGNAAPQYVGSGVKEEKEAMIPARDDEGSSVETEEELGDNDSVRSNSPPKDYSGGGYDGVEGEVEDLRDPFLLFLQCRCYAPHPLSNPNDYDQAVQQAHLDFDQLAETYLYRRDVAFFAIVIDCDNGKNLEGGFCRDMSPSSSIEEEKKGVVSGTVWTLRVLPPLQNSSPPIKWIGIPNTSDKSRQYPLRPVVFWNPHHVPKSTTPTNTNMADLTMPQFVVAQTTPSVLYFDHDRFSASTTMAFPIYRRVHVVLFVDVHTPQLRTRRMGTGMEGGEEMEEESFFRPSAGFEARYRRVVLMLRSAALEHRMLRPMEDAVFMVVPSTAVRVMKTFGIDIWSEMDRDCMASKEGCTLPEDGIPLLPIVMLTSRRQNHPTMARYYLHADDLLPTKYTDGDADTDASLKLGRGSIHTLLSTYYDAYTTSQSTARLTPAIKSEPTPHNRTLNSGVQIATGNTFHSIVTSSTTHHSLVQFYSPTCGHCKRFAIVWSDLARSIRHLNWHTHIDVLKVDTTQNEVHVEGVDVRNVPAVYFFPRGEKDHPFELTVAGDLDGESNVGGISDAIDVLEWMVGLEGVFEEADLIELVSLITAVAK